MVVLELRWEILGRHREIDVPKMMLVDDARTDLVSDFLQLWDLIEDLNCMLFLEP